MPQPLIELEDVSVVRGGKPILNRLSLRIDVGESVAVLGPNGCGKSTLLRLLTREIHPWAGRGSVRILGDSRWLQRDLRKALGIVGSEPKEPFLGEPTVRELVVSGLLGTFGVLSFDIVDESMWARADRAIELVGMTELSERLVETLSLGETRRSWVARALVAEPKALVLDEPTTGLDLAARAHFLRTVGGFSDHGVSTILVTHHFEEIAPSAQRVILMSQGSVVSDGKPQDVLNSGVLSEIYGVPVEVQAHSGGWNVWVKPE